eukprot:CAMPEP_0116992138 /NCGR_PEP_ID=MMETSP0467-20121206/66609_1 /TAXON_ID=283647 /ORGANISM="Mesodinium pulex, Strain SPMC105" /LENGTH=66 /DNA_ID=CAMNT_0004689463 /DNA_START=1451 /DNA_END=1648 /DNA_ORIENTATION=-
MGINEIEVKEELGLGLRVVLEVEKGVKKSISTKLEVKEELGLGLGLRVVLEVEVEKGVKKSIFTKT